MTIGSRMLYNVFIYYIILCIVKYIFYTQTFWKKQSRKERVRGSDDKVTKDWRKIHTEEHYNTNYVAALGSVRVDGYLRNNLRPAFTLPKHDKCKK